MQTFIKFKNIVFFIVLFSRQITAQIKLPQLIRDSMVLQRDANLKIWGWAAPNEKVTISFNNKNYKTIAHENGKWFVMLAPQKAGGPYEMKLKASNEILLKDILIGDVWLCSGQSNMVHQMKLHAVRYADEIANANNANIRHFIIPNATSLQGPKDDLPSGNWKSANPTDVMEFSAVAYFFANKIYEKYHVPIGLINASVGGTPIEAWISENGWDEFADIKKTIEKNRDTAYLNNLNRKAANVSNAPKSPTDKGLIGALPWYNINYVPKEWHNINIPGYWEDQGIKDLDGIVWYRKEIEIPPSFNIQNAKIFLGRIVDADELYINGQKVGNTTYQYPQRRYAIKQNILKAGKNLFVIRVTNYSGKGGFVADKPYCLIAGNDTIDLKGTWQYKVGDVFVPNQNNIAAGIVPQNQPSALYNAMVAPYTNYSIKGILWYQGEANTGRAEAYAKLLPALVADWRKQFNNPNAPFINAQLPNFMDVNYLPSESQWAALREAQLKGLSIPNSAMTVNIDLGEWNDIHPDNKKPVGERMALAALKIAYGENDIISSGPIYQSNKIDGNKIILNFSNTGSGLVSNDNEELRWFAIAGADKKFVWANAKIEGNTIIVWNDAIANPLYVRYAWADNPQDVNFYNKEGLPASPFRTDN